MESGEKSVLLISNDQDSAGWKNTLTNFSGSIPPNFLDRHKSWKVALHSFGLHLELKQALSPKYENFPSLIQITFKDFEALVSKYNVASTEDLSLNMFESALKFYIDRQKSYTSKSLVEDFKLQQGQNNLYESSDFQSTPLIYEEDSDQIAFGQFEIDGRDSEERISKLPRKERKSSRTFLFFNKYFKDGLNIQVEKNGLNWNTAYIDKELYYYLFNSKIWRSKNIYPFKSKNKFFLIKEPKIVRILSPNIKHSINNTKFDQCLREFTTTNSDIGKYIHRELENFEFFDVLNDFIDSFEVKFVDESYRQLRLGQGLSTWAKLVFTPLMGAEENVRISSASTELYPNNSISNFNVELPKSLDYSWKKNPRVCLTRISFKNKWGLLPGLRLDFFIYNIEAEENKFQYFQCPREKNGPRSCLEIVNWFKNKIKEAGTSLWLANQANGNYSLIFNKKCILIVGRDLAQCLGFAFVNQKVNNFPIRARIPSNNVSVHDDELYIKTAISKYAMNNPGGFEINVQTFACKGDVMISAERHSTHRLNFPPRDIEIYPNDLYLFCNIVEPSIVAGGFKQLLRIVPLPYDKQDENITIEFPKPDYHELRELKPRSLQFEITTMDGKYVKPYNEEDNFYLNLKFDHE